MKKKASKTKAKRPAKLDPSQLAALVVARATGQPIPKGITPEQVAEYDRQKPKR